MLKNLYLPYCLVVLGVIASVFPQVGSSQVQLDRALPAYQYGGSLSIAKTIAVKGKELGLNPRSSMTFTNLGSGDVYFALYSNMEIRQFNITTNQYLGAWPLGHYVCANEDRRDCNTPWWEGRWSSDEALERELQDRINGSRYPVRYFYSGAVPKITPGCMGKNPLRYGDIDGDGVNELVIVLIDALIIFSTTSNQTIFSMMWNVNDWLSSEETLDEVYDGDVEPDYPQYASKFLVGSNNGFAEAYRGYAKIYVDDFDNDSRADIVVWRKLYESRALNDPINGFIPKGNTFVHYELIDGEYKIQETEQSDIEGWLSTKQLTWQKGYPNLSECPGQTDQHIPEMIDPLLNDPEVLQ